MPIIAKLDEYFNNILGDCQHKINYEYSEEEQIENEAHRTGYNKLRRREPDSIDFLIEIKVKYIFVYDIFDEFFSRKTGKDELNKIHDRLVSLEDLRETINHIDRVAANYNYTGEKTEKIGYGTIEVEEEITYQIVLTSFSKGAFLMQAGSPAI
ncbi:MAG: hypothetical protein ACRDBG_04575 [Waterburya sp.]